MPTNFPTSLDSNADLFVAQDQFSFTSLVQPAAASDTTLSGITTAGYPASDGLLSIDNEQILYTGLSGNTFTGCVRGMNGTMAVAHAIGAPVQMLVVAAHHNNLKDAVIALEGVIGTNGVNLNTTYNPLGTATNLSNYNSSQLALKASYWNGSAAAIDSWNLQATVGSGTNPASVLTVGHGGSSGAASISLQAPVELVAGTVTLPALGFAAEATTGIFQSAAGSLNIAVQGVQAAQFTNASTVINSTGVVITHRVTSYNGDTLVGNGFVTAVTAVDLTSQSASIPTTTLYTAAAAGLYEISYWMFVVIPDTSGATVQLTLTGTGDGATPIFNPPTLPFVSTGVTSGTYVQMLDAAAACSYATTVTGVPSAGRYTLHVRVKRLG